MISIVHELKPTTIAEFEEKHSQQDVNWTRLWADAKKMIGDKDDIGKGPTMAVDFAETVLYTVIPELRTVKPRERDKSFKLSIGGNHITIRSYKNATAKTPYKYKTTEISLSLSIKLASILAFHIVSVINLSQTGDNITLTPLAASHFLHG